MLRNGSFYVIYVMMTMVAFGGLVVTAQLSPIASSYHVDKVIVAFGMRLWCWPSKLIVS